MGLPEVNSILKAGRYPRHDGSKSGLRPIQPVVGAVPTPITITNPRLYAMLL